MISLREVNTRLLTCVLNFQFQFHVQTHREYSPSGAQKKKKKRKEFEKQEPRVAFILQDGGLAGTFCRKKTVSTRGREISLAPVVSRHPAVRFVHGI